MCPRTSSGGRNAKISARPWKRLRERPEMVLRPVGLTKPATPSSKFAGIMKMPTEQCACVSADAKGRRSRRPLFRLPTTLEITEEHAARPAVVPIVIDGAIARVRHSQSRPAQNGPDRSQGWLHQGARIRERATRKTCSSSSTPACVLGRLDAGGHLVTGGEEQAASRQGVAGGLEAEKSPRPARDVEICWQRRRDFRACAHRAAGQSADARARVAAIAGLARLSRDDNAETLLRAAWTNPKEAYGARQPRCAAWPVEGQRRR